MFKGFLGKAYGRVGRLFDRETIKQNPVRYWEKRARDFGQRAVLNLGHSEAEFKMVTEWQKKEIYPYFVASLAGNERVILDLGCGPARFTGDLAAMIQGKAIGVDIISEFIKMAPKRGNAEFLTMQEGKIPLPDTSVDIVWVCLVLGGLKGEVLERTVDDIDRVLKPGGLLFLVENTSEIPDASHWFYRQAPQYKTLCSFANLKHLSDYFDMGERISILAGRKLNGQ